MPENTTTVTKTLELQKSRVTALLSRGKLSQKKTKIGFQTLKHWAMFAWIQKGCVIMRERKPPKGNWLCPKVWIMHFSLKSQHILMFKMERIQCYGVYSEGVGQIESWTWTCCVDWIIWEAFAHWSIRATACFAIPGTAYQPLLVSELNGLNSHFWQQK